MRWHKQFVRAMNLTRGASLGDRVRLANKGHERIVGLLGETRLDAGDGLLIIPSQGVHTLGMLFPIDVVVLDRDWKVIAIRHGMRPFRMTRVFFAGAAVLELPSGTAAATNTRVGDSMDFVRVEAKRHQAVL